MWQNILTALPSKEVLRDRLNLVIEQARQRLEAASGMLR